MFIQAEARGGLPPPRDRVKNPPRRGPVADNSNLEALGTEQARKLARGAAAHGGFSSPVTHADFRERRPRGKENNPIVEQPRVDTGVFFHCWPIRAAPDCGMRGR